MKKNSICSKKSVRTLLLKLEPYFLSHAERGESLQIQDFLGGIHLCRHFVPTPFRLPIPIFNSGGEGEIRTREGFAPLLAFQASALGHYATSPKQKLFYKDYLQAGFRAISAALERFAGKSLVDNFFN